MTAEEFLLFLNPWELSTICRLNKAGHHLMHKIVNLKVLFAAQGITLTPEEAEVAKISLSVALKVVANREL